MFHLQPLRDSKGSVYIQLLESDQYNNTDHNYNDDGYNTSYYYYDNDDGENDNKRRVYGDKIVASDMSRTKK